jgi:hypothetical protein
VLTFHNLARAIGAAVLVQLAGCASFEFTKALPDQKQPVSVAVSGEELSGWTDLPIGVYRVPDSQVIISGHQTGQGGALLFGLVGVAIAHAGNATAGANAVKDAENQLHINLDAPLKALLDDAVAKGAFGPQFTTVKGSAKRLTLTPALVMSFVNDKDVRPYVVVRADLIGNDPRKPEWKGRFMASSGESRPLLGDGGWLASDGQLLKETVKRNLELVMSTLAADVRQPYPRDDTKLSTLQGNFPYVKRRFQAVGYVLKEDDAYYTFVPKIGDVIVFSGVNIVDKKFVKMRPAIKDEPNFKFADEETK